MFEVGELKSLAAESSLILIGEPVDDPDVNGGSIVFVKATGQEPASVPGLIVKFSRKLKEKGWPVKIVGPNQGEKQIGTFIGAAIKARLPDIELDLTIAAGLGKIAIWVDLPLEPSAEEKAEINSVIQNFLSQLGFKDQIVRFKKEKNYPSPTACLRVLRRNAPCSPETLTQLLQLPGFDPMTVNEIRRVLDTARRKGQVIRRGDGKYIMSLQGLMNLGSSRDRFSPDISRALALRRLGA
ncbi:hypothetical protein [Leisingera caerulea]|uniref:Uncharacterized protein n=1 Tax=Leisingera caerulea TaxID=506591 RepID=A0A9Q9HMZ1_LEICA|nr:hypothetical protein [Leisingera caerulea]UWQ55939.1 hypothetical protein K3721_19080 [Leisingera caerulea]